MPRKRSRKVLWERGSARRAGCLLAAGALCGLLWEFWNSGAGAQWHYTVPFVGVLKVFEMPLLGFLGFPPFALECFAMTSLFFAVLGRLEARLGRAAARALAVLLLLLFSLGVFAGIDHFTVVSWAKRG